MRLYLLMLALIGLEYVGTDGRAAGRLLPAAQEGELMLAAVVELADVAGLQRGIRHALGHFIWRHSASSFTCSSTC
eukprot:3274710-Heterocapsa_arctica.AAC.1